MTRAVARATEVTAPRATAALASVLGFGVLAQGAFAGGFLAGHHMWLAWHEDVGDFLIMLPLASLVLGLPLGRRRPEPRTVLALRVALVVLVVAVIATGHAAGALLAVHVPAAVATMALVVGQVVLSHSALQKATGAGASEEA
jgi:hypothetical protein